MKKLIQICSLLSLIVAFSFLSASAQSTRKIEAQVPFDFNVGDKNYPAGTYELRISESRSNGAIVYLTDGEKNILETLLVSISGNSVNGDSKLVFNNYNGQRFLSRIEARENSYRVARSGIERQIAGGKKSAARTPEVVALALKTEL
jgi:hypothetical protein